MTSIIQVAARFVYRITTALEQDYASRFAVKASYIYSTAFAVIERAEIPLYLLTEGGDFLATESGFYLKLEQVQ